MLSETTEPKYIISRYRFQMNKKLCNWQTWFTNLQGVPHHNGWCKILIWILETSQNSLKNWKRQIYQVGCQKFKVFWVFFVDLALKLYSNMIWDALYSLDRIISFSSRLRAYREGIFSEMSGRVIEGG